MSHRRKLSLPFLSYNRSNNYPGFRKLSRTPATPASLFHPTRAGYVYPYILQGLRLPSRHLSLDRIGAAMVGIGGRYLTARAAGSRYPGLDEWDVQWDSD